MADFDLVIRGSRVITRAGEVPRCIAVRDGVVVAVEPLEAELEGVQTVELADDEVLLPGLVDTHVHVNEPGRTEWEGYETATRAAAAGGVTTIIDMPLNSIPPTCTVEALEVKQKAARGKCHVDVGFWGGAIPGNLGDLRGLHDAGVFGFKCFMTHSGVEEFPPLSAEQLEEYLGVLASYGATMIVHAEDATAIERAPAPTAGAYADFLASRPRGAENVAIAHLIEAARHTGASVHLLHLSSSDAVPMLRTARREGIRMTVETCPHYLVFRRRPSPTERPSSSAARRSARRTTARSCGTHWAAATSTASSPTTRRARPTSSGSTSASSGCLGRDLLAAARAAGGVDRGPARGYTLADVVRWMAERPARHRPPAAQGADRPRLPRRLRRLRARRRVRRRPGRLHHRNPVTPYA